MSTLKLFAAESIEIFCHRVYLEVSIAWKNNLTETKIGMLTNQRERIMGKIRTIADKKYHQYKNCNQQQNQSVISSSNMVQDAY